MAGPRHPQPGSDPDPLELLGLPAWASEGEIEAARRRLAKHIHPDVGGSLERMQQINAAADAARRRLSIPTAASDVEPRRWRAVWRDHPSFTIEALPAEAFEALVIVAAVLGEMIDDDPPYRLDVALTEPIAGWCRVELVPEAGASSVTLTLAESAADLDQVRDAWIAELNRLDWADLDGSLPQP